jgi:ribosomal protein S6
MTETTMPATEVQGVDDQDVVAYELAYHILPTVAEGEVTSVTDELKALVAKAGGTITDEEIAERFELAYEIDKYLEGKYRKFTSAYFGWVRFTLTPAALAGLTEGVEEHKQLLRYLLVRLTKVEEVNPFRFHDALEKTPVRTIDMDAETAVVESEVVDTEGIVDAVVEEEVKIA